VSFAGTDVDAPAIGWNKSHFPFGDFRVNCETPPVDFSASTFDLIYAISVFSHLAERNHLEWLAELRRLARPGALVILTVHGEHALRRTEQEEATFRFLQITREGLARAREDLESRQYAFVRQPDGHLNTDLYGVTFISRQYVQRHWTDAFEVLAYLEGGISEWQDVVVLQPRPSARI
jgi:hypothetical protein